MQQERVEPMGPRNRRDETLVFGHPTGKRRRQRTGRKRRRRETPKGQMIGDGFHRDPGAEQRKRLGSFGEVCFDWLTRRHRQPKPVFIVAKNKNIFGRASA
jgi:hypothetical protein